MVSRTRSLRSKWGVLILLLVVVVSSALYWFYKGKEAAESRSDVSVLLHTDYKQVFEPVLPNQPVKLPNDFRFHPAYQHEWWHYFANLTDDNGNEYGVQWSYFRVSNDERNRSGWQNPQLYFSHAVVSTEDNVWKEQRIARGGIGQAGMSDRPFRLWIDNWSWRSLGQTPYPGHLDIQSDDFGFSLRSSTSGPFALPGEKGYQAKHDLLPVASYNLAAPFLTVEGELRLGKGGAVRVKGNAWMSKEWGSALLADGQIGWDWFVFQLDDETMLSVSQYRHEQQLAYKFGMLSTNDGKVVALTDTDLQITPEKIVSVSGRKLPLRWTIEVPQYGIKLSTEALNEQTFLPFVIPYWEGAIRTTGTHEASGFMQLTGY